MENKERLIEICEAVSADVKKDISDFEGKEFNGKNVATLFGYQAAAIDALARVLKEILDSNQLK